MEKLDGINISEAAQIKRKIGAPAPGRKEKLTKVIVIRITSSVPNANMWNTVHVKTSKQKLSTPSKNAMAVPTAQRCQNGSVFAETIGIDAIYIDIVCQ